MPRAGGASRLAAQFPDRAWELALLVMVVTGALKWGSFQPAGILQIRGVLQPPGRLVAGVP
eukprot:2065189-Lingulodinium_polyedra.AAC.1